MQISISVNVSIRATTLDASTTVALSLLQVPPEVENMNLKMMKAVRLIAAGSLLLGAAIVSPAQQPDNTKTNKRDRDKSAATADRAKDNATDRDMMQKIRNNFLR